MANPVKLYKPEASAVVLAVLAPVRFTVAPEPPAPLIVPLTVYVPAAPANERPSAWPLLMVAVWFAGEKVAPLAVGVTVYVPLASPLKEKLPELSAVTVLFAAPLRVIVAPAAPVPERVPATV